MSALDENEDRPIQSETGDDPNLSEFQKLKKDILAAQRARSKWRTEAKEAFDFVASFQWSEEDKRILDSQHRPAVTFNRCAPIINAVCGLEVNNRQGVVYLPRTEGDTGVNEMITNTGKWIRDECHAEDEESEAFRDNVICGEGWTETRMDYDEDPRGMIVEERIDPLEMGVNKGACRRNYVDARMMYRVREMEPEDARALLDLDPELLAAAMDAKWLDEGITPADGGEGNKRDYPDKTRDAVAELGGRRTTVKIVQCQYWRREPVNMVATDTDEQMQEMTDEEFAIFEARANAINQAADLAQAMDPLSPAQRMEYQHARVTKKVYYECFIGQRILQAPRKLEMGKFQFVPMTGHRDRKNKCFYGMLRDMFDPQRWANKWLAQTMNIMNTNAKGGLLAETDAFINIRKAQRDWSDPTKIVWVKPGSLQKQKVKERTPSQLPPGLENLMMFAISSIRDVTGVNLELLGQADREQAASLEAQRRQSAMTVLASLFDSLRRYRKIQGKLMLHFIWLLPEGTLVRVLDQGQYKYIPLTKQGLEIEKFDVIIDQAPTSPDQKQFIWAVTAQILQMQILPPAAIIELLKYSPYPESVVAEIRKALGLDGELPPDQLAEQLKQAEGALQVLEQELVKAQEAAKTAEDQRAIDMLKLEIEEYEAKTERLNNQWQARIKMADAVAKRADAQMMGTGTSNAPGMSMPDLGTGNGGAQLPELPSTGLEAKVDQLATMVGQLVQMLQPQQPQEPVQPPAEFQEPPAELGEM